MDAKLLKRTVKRLKEYARIIDMYNDDAVEKIIELLPSTEDLIDELEDELVDKFQSK